ncbi:hypothetical protein ACJIZ3_009091 [Penstemon smallii]|uniref:Uncharacterized protein n=1 Tax=Penstemon smallii TaxID=265156 RepID=A0ABD3TCY5_9LAMI
MIELEDKSIEEGETPMSEDQILVEALGHRFGYQKNAKTKISTLTIELEEQKERNKNNGEKIETLQAQMQQLGLRMQSNNTTPIVHGKNTYYFGNLIFKREEFGKLLKLRYWG